MDREPAVNRERSMVALGVVFLFAYAIPILWRNAPRALVEICSVTQLIVWALFALDFIVRLIRSENKGAFFGKNWVEVVLIAVPALRPLRPYLIETFFATKSWGKKADIDPAWVADQDKAKVESGTYKPNKTKNEEEAKVDAKKTRRIPAIGPTVKAKKGKFRTNSEKFPQLRPDGRLAHTKDHGAATGYRGAGASRKSGLANGRDKHALVSSGYLPNGQHIPPFLRAYVCPPGGNSKSEAAKNVLNLAIVNGLTPSKVSLDRIYTASPAEDLEHIVSETGWQVVKDLKEVHRTRTQPQTGVRYIDGWWYTTGIKPGLLVIPRPPQNATNEVRQALQKRFDQRRPYAFRTMGTTPTGLMRLRGPAVPDSV